MTILCDTCIFFEIFRGNDAVINEFETIGYENLAICDLTIGEIYYGMKKSEERKTKELMSLFKRFRLTKDVSKHFVEIMSDNFGYRLAIPDALIASVGLANDLSVFTLNIADFKKVRGLKLYKPKSKLT